MEKKEVLEDNGIPEEYFLRKKRLQQFQDMLKQFKKKQEERKFDIIEKLIKEERMNKEQKQRQSQVKPTIQRKGGRVPRRATDIGFSGVHLEAVHAALTGTRLEAGPERREGEEEKGKGEEEGGQRLPPSEPSSDTEELADYFKRRKPTTASVIEPEIRGLWDQQQQASGGGGKEGGEEGGGEEGGSTSDDRPLKREKSKAEITMMENAMDKLRKSKITKQIAAGKEFKVSLECEVEPLFKDTLNNGSIKDTLFSKCSLSYIARNIDL